MTAGDKTIAKRTGQLVSTRLRTRNNLPAGTELQTVPVERVAGSASLQGAAANTSTSTLNSGRVKPETMSSVELGTLPVSAMNSSRARM